MHSIVYEKYPSFLRIFQKESSVFHFAMPLFSFTSTICISLVFSVFVVLLVCRVIAILKVLLVIIIDMVYTYRV